ncbi:MAG: hypothetical protein CMO34_05465 [Verrucomicrobia bacterium]|nr:hypothetical protein [Verrucomicrobiota bacterium]
MKKSKGKLNHIDFQYIIIPTILTPMLIILIITLYVIEFGNKPISLEALIISCLILFLLFLNSFSLTIGVKNEVLYASLGIGLIKNSININHIKFVEPIKVPWYAGIGLRIYNHSIMYNAKPGIGIKINYDKNKSLIIIPRDVDKFYAIFSDLGIRKIVESET